MFLHHDHFYCVEHGYGLHVLGAFRPQIGRPSHLTHGVHARNELANGEQPEGQLPNPHEKPKSKLADNRQTAYDLADTKQYPDPELGHRDCPKSKLPDSDNPFGDTGLSSFVGSKGHAHQGDAEYTGSGTPVKTSCPRDSIRLGIILARFISRHRTGLVLEAFLEDL